MNEVPSGAQKTTNTITIGILTCLLRLAVSGVSAMQEEKETDTDTGNAIITVFLTEVRKIIFSNLKESIKTIEL